MLMLLLQMIEIVLFLFKAVLVDRLTRVSVMSSHLRRVYVVDVTYALIVYTIIIS